MIFIPHSNTADYNRFYTGIYIRKLPTYLNIDIIPGIAYVGRIQRHVISLYTRLFIVISVKYALFAFSIIYQFISRVIQFYQTYIAEHAKHKKL